MASTPAGPSSEQYWSQYAHDARDLLTTLLQAGSSALRVWTSAWCDYATSAAKNQQQMARRWNEIIQEPGRGMAVLDQMRQDYKQYLVDVGGIPERAILDFLVEVSSVPVGKRTSLDQRFVDAASAATDALAEALNALEVARESLPAAAPAQPKAPPGGRADEKLAEVRQRMADLREAHERLRKASEARSTG